MSNNKSRSTKPYDSSNSFVKKVASRVSGLIPRSTSWLSGWFSPPPSAGEVPIEREEKLQNEEEHFEDALEKPPPAKRFRLTSNQEYVHTYLADQNVNQGDSNSRLVPNNFDASAIPGPSGIGTRSSGFVASTPAVTSVEHHEPKANGDDCSESGESTSGCSSLEPQLNRGQPSAQIQSRQNDSLSPRKRVLDDKQNYSYLQNSRSLYLDRTSKTHNSQTIGRRNNPSFCVNTFGSPLFGERGNVNDMILNSPFYIGRTTYGGASSSSYRRSVGSTSLSSSPANSEKLAKHTIKVKPGHSHPSEDSGMSQTAKRILATLEQFSTPILDAKRIPVAQEPVLSSLGSRKRARGDNSGNSQLLLEQPRVPQRTPNKPLHWAKGGPRTTQLTIPVVPDTLILRRREIVQDSGQNSTSVPSSSANVESYALRLEKENSVTTRNTLKMKPRLNNERESKEPEMGSEVNLPKISLPISSLPTFDISVPAPKPIVSKPPQASNVSCFGNNTRNITSAVTKHPISAPSTSSPSLKVQDTSTDTSFSFSSPISVSTVAKDQPLSAVNNFTFSKPLPASAKFSEPVFNCISARPKASEPMKQSDDFLGGLKPASELKTGSVMDILGKSKCESTKNSSESANGNDSLMEKFKPAALTWECDKCLIRNKSDLTKCAACTNPREVKIQTLVSASSETKATSSVSSGLKNETSFGAQFKMSEGMWECSMCMVRNKDSDEKCVSCTNPKPGAAPVKPATPAANFSGWGDKFKPSSNTWECSVCMVRNGSELTACQSCTTKKPGSSGNAVAPIKNSWGDQFKKPEGSWTCSDCMVTNKATDLKCVACSCKKPGSESSSPSPKQNSKFSFGIPAASDKGSSTPAFSFGIPKDSKETNQGGKPNVTSSTGFKFGESKPAAPATGFTFGVPSTNPSTPTGQPPASSCSSAATSVLTSPSTAVASKSISSESKPADIASVQPLPIENNKSIFSFGVTKSSTPPMFSFGRPAGSSPTSQPSSSTASPLGGKRKLGDDAPSSSGPLKFGIGGGNQSDSLSQAKPVITSSSSVSSTSGPVFAFSPVSLSTSSPASTLLSASVTSTANGQNKVDGPTVATTNSIFSSVVSSPTSSLSAAKPAPAFGLSVATTKDESVTSTWKTPTSSNTTTNADTKSNLESNGATGNTKPAFTFGSIVSSSGMAFGASAGSATPSFTFGGTSDKTATMNKPAASFGSHASSTTLFGSTTGSLSNATLAFGSPNSGGFGSLTTNTSQPFQVKSDAAPSFSAPSSASAFSSAFGTSEEKKSGFQFNAPSEGKKPAFPFSPASDEKKTAFAFGGKTEDPNKPTFSFSNTTTAQNSFQSSSSSNVFTFGASEPAANGPAKPAFSFGSQTASFSGFNSQPQSSSPAAFNFGAPNTFGTANNSTAPTPSVFEGANSTPMFASPISNFGSPFGSSSQLPSTFPVAGPPSFGTQSQTSATPSPFAFTETQKPTFNFTQGAPVNFAAAPQDVAGAPPRRFKKATRRAALR